MSYVRCKVIGAAQVVGVDGLLYEPGEEVILDDTKTRVDLLEGINWQVLEVMPAGYEPAVLPAGHELGQSTPAPAKPGSSKAN